MIPRLFPRSLVDVVLLPVAVANEIVRSLVVEPRRRRDRILAEIDRNARAYGWEIGRGHPLVERIESTDPENPFLAADWRTRLRREVSS